MKKKHPVLISFLVVIAIILGWKSLEKPRQIAFLKRHEKEMTAFIKKYSSEDEDIKFHWDTVNDDPDMMFSEPKLTVVFDITDSSEPKYNRQGYMMEIKTNLKVLKKIDELIVLDDPILTNIDKDRETISSN